MDVFTEIKGEAWDVAVQASGHGSVFMGDVWSVALARVLPFVTVRYYRYRDTYLLRVAHIGGRVTTMPFSDGSDVIAVIGEGSPLDLTAFQSDVRAQFGEGVRIRVNERFLPVTGGEEDSIVAHDYVVDLSEPLLPRVRKTLRHILEKPPVGQIEKRTDRDTIEAAYRLYLAHMRRVHNFALPQRLFRAFIEEHGGELFVWSRGDEPEAMAIFVSNGTEVLYSLSAANAEAFAARIPHHLVYTALESYRERGVVRASLGATGKGSSLEVFKRGWRGEEKCIYEIGSRGVRTRKASKVRRLVQFVPLSFYPLLAGTLGKRFF